MKIKMHAKVVWIKKSMVLNTCIRKKGFNFMILASALRNKKKKKQQIKTIVNRREILKVRTETNEIENRKTKKEK